MSDDAMLEPTADQPETSAAQDEAAQATDAAPADAEQPVKPQRRRFRPSTVVKADPLLVSRQAEAATLAFRMFGNAEAARAFLNNPHDQLGGRPIDIAGESPDGLGLVVATLRGEGVAPPSVG